MRVTDEMINAIHKARLRGQIHSAMLNSLERALLQYAKDVSLILQKHHKALFAKLGHRGACKLCGEEIYYLPLLSGDLEPYGLDGAPHLEVCRAHLRKRGNAT